MPRFLAPGTSVIPGWTVVANVAFGTAALSAIGAGVQNTAVGYAAMQTTPGTNNCTAVGFAALQNVTGTSNTGIGQGAGVNLTAGGNHTFVGASTGLNSTTQYHGTVAIGQAARTDGHYAIAIGHGVTALASGAVAIGRDSANTPATTSVANEIKLGTALHTVKVLGGCALGTSGSSLLGFYGTAPIARPATTPAAATDPATTMALVNSLRASLIALGLIA